MSLTDRTIDAQQHTYEGLADRVRRLSDEELIRPSGATDWTVAQVLSHLGSGAEIHLDTLRAALAGHERDNDLNDAIWARWNAMTPREQADGFLERGRDFVDALAALSSEERNSLTVPLSFLPEPAGLDLYVGLRLNEDALHGWDVAVALDENAEIATDVAQVLLELHRGPLAFLLAFTSKPAPRSVALTVTTPDATLGLALGETAALTDVPAAPDGELRLPLPTFLRLLAGRLPVLPEDALDGDVTPAELQQVFPGY
jgi:uncharacterized protein (TIGR03083 family)